MCTRSAEHTLASYTVTWSLTCISAISATSETAEILEMPGTLGIPEIEGRPEAAIRMFSTNSKNEKDAEPVARGNGGQSRASGWRGAFDRRRPDRLVHRCVWPPCLILSVRQIMRSLVRNLGLR